MLIKNVFLGFLDKLGIKVFVHVITRKAGGCAPWGQQFYVNFHWQIERRTTGRQVLSDESISWGGAKSQ